MCFVRILPEMCANTTDSFSSLIRKNALGNASMTVPLQTIPEAFVFSFFSVGLCFDIINQAYSRQHSSQYQDLWTVPVFPE